MSVKIERTTLYQSIRTLPDRFLPELAEFVAFLQLKARQKISAQEILSSDAVTSGESGASASLKNNALERAAQLLFDDYLNNQELTSFTSLDGEDFYA